MIYGKYSPDLRMAQEMKVNTAQVGTQPQNYEIILEATHLFQLNPWFSIMPDIQYVINPKGYGTIPNALVLGAQVSLTF
jgi:porin